MKRRRNHTLAHHIHPLVSNHREWYANVMDAQMINQPPANPRARKYRQRIDHRADIRVPIKTFLPERPLPNAETQRNTLLLNQRKYEVKRPLVRITFESYARVKAGPVTWHRLPGQHVILSCPTAPQGLAAIKAIQDVCAALNGQWLVEDAE